MTRQPNARVTSFRLDLVHGVPKHVLGCAISVSNLEELSSFGCNFECFLNFTIHFDVPFVTLVSVDLYWFLFRSELAKEVIIVVIEFCFDHAWIGAAVAKLRPQLVVDRSRSTFFRTFPWRVLELLTWSIPNPQVGSPLCSIENRTGAMHGELVVDTVGVL